MVDRRRSWHLPDEVVIRILSFLPVEEIARAKLVSKPWQKLSEFCFVPPLTFECPSRSRPIYDSRHATYTDGYPSSINLIDSTLKLHFQKNLILSTLRLRLDLCRIKSLDSHSLLDSWIEGALERKVGHLDLCFPYSSYSIPAQVFAARTITDLCLEIFRLEIHENLNIDLPALRKLRLIQIQSDQQAIQRLLSSCPSIRDLEISSCHDLHTLYVSGFADLHRLSVLYCDRLQRIEIDVRTLRYLRHHHGESPCVMILTSGEFIGELILWNSYIADDLFHYLVSGLPNLERLEMNHTRLKTIQILNHRLKRLDITLTMKQKNSIFKIDTPNLRSLKYTGHRMPFDSIISSLNTSSLHETEISFIGYNN